MSQNIGTIVYGDTGSPIRYTVTQGGTVLDVTGASDIKLSIVRHASGVDVAQEITGAIFGAPANGTFEFIPIGSVVAAPESRFSDHVYEARVKFTLATKLYWTESFRFSVAKFP